MDNTSKQTDGTSQTNAAQGGVTQNNASQNSTVQNGAPQSTASQSGAATGGASSLTSLPGMKAEVATWVQFIRRPGMVLSLDIQKRYVSNMDAETASGTQGNSRAVSVGSPSAMAVARPPLKASPAPVVSTALTLREGTSTSR